MKKMYRLMTAVVAMAFMTACGTKPAETENQSEPEAVCEEIVVIEEAEMAEETVPAAEEDSIEAVDSAEVAEAAEEPIEETETAEAVEEEDNSTVFLVVSERAKAPCSDEEIIKMLTFKVADVAPDAEPCRILVTCIIEKDGHIRKAEIRRPTGNEKLEAAAIEAVKKLPAFEPARNNGSPVRMSLTLPVRFI